MNGGLGRKFGGLGLSIGGPRTRLTLRPADANERGWKDTFRMNPGEVTRILVRFAPQDESPAFAFDATAAPGTGNDSSQGYSPGSFWTDTTHGDLYVCTSAAAGDAVEDEAEHLALHEHAADRWEGAWRFGRLAGERARGADLQDAADRALPQGGRPAPGAERPHPAHPAADGRAAPAALLRVYRPSDAGRPGR